MNMKKLFVLDKGRNDDYAKELLCAFDKVNAAETGADSVSVEDFNVSILAERSIDVLISNGLAPEIHAAIKEQGVVSIVFDQLSTHGVLADIVIDHKAKDPTSNYAGPSFSLLSNPDFDFVALSDLIRKMPWDTNFWSLGYGQLKTKNFTKNIYQKVDAYARQNDISFLEYLCNSDDQKNFSVAEDEHFHLGDIRITFDVKGKKVDMDPLPEGFTYGIAEERHIPELHNISKDLYKISRYYYDGRFDKAKVSEFYKIWVEKAVHGTFDHICYCVFKGDRPVGFATFRYLKPGTAMFGLGAFSDEFQGFGLGRKLFRHVININTEKGVNYVTSATQGKNIMTQRMHQSIDFRTATVELWYHKWLS